MLWPHAFLAALLLMLAPALAQRVDGANKILYPGVAGLSFNYMDTVDVDFETDYTTPWMYIFCNQSNGNLQEVIYYSPSDVLKSNVRPFTLSYTYMPETKCWFNLRSAQRDSGDDNTLEGATSPAWSYNATEGSHATFASSSTATSTAGTASSTSTDATSSTASTTASGLATAPPPSSAMGTFTATVTAQPSSSSDSSNSGGLTTGAKAGIGAAIGGVGLAAHVAAMFLLLRRRRRRAGPDQRYKLDSPTMATTDKALPPTPPRTQTVRAQSGPYELSQDRELCEMPQPSEYYELH